jgi:hypothetical protein
VLYQYKTSAEPLVRVADWVETSEVSSQVEVPSHGMGKTSFRSGAEKARQIPKRPQAVAPHCLLGEIPGDEVLRLAMVSITDSEKAASRGSRIIVRVGRQRYAIDISFATTVLATETDPAAERPPRVPQMETKFLRLRQPATLGDRIDGWRVCWLGGWDRGRLFYVVMVERN